jgi:hypothetical protein
MQDLSSEDPALQLPLESVDFLNIGTQFTSFTGTKGQSLTQQLQMPIESIAVMHIGTQFTCFAGTKVQILTHFTCFSGTKSTNSDAAVLTQARFRSRRQDKWPTPVSTKVQILAPILVRVYKY